MSEVKTTEQLKKEFLRDIRATTVYWAKEECPSDLDRCEGVAHAILFLMEGSKDLFEKGMMSDPSAFLHDLFYTDQMKTRSQEEANNSQIAVADKDKKIKHFKAGLEQLGIRLQKLRDQVKYDVKVDGFCALKKEMDQCQQEYNAFDAVIKQLEKES